MSTTDKLIAELKTQIDDKNFQIESLQADIADMLDNREFNVIETPLGKVEYLVTGSLKLVQFMEDAERRIRDL